MAEALPKGVSLARFAMRALTFFWFIAAAFCALAVFRLHRGGFVVYVLIYLTCAGVACLVASCLVSRGMRAGRIAAWLVLPLCLALSPVGIALAIYAIYNLESAEMKEYFKRQAGTAPQQAIPPSLTRQ